MAPHTIHRMAVQVETYFKATASLSQYFISMFKAGTLYYWVDSTFIGGLNPKAGNPYVHVSAGSALISNC